jgi:hypothetical protein
LLEAAVSRAGTEVIFSSTNESNIAMRALFDHDGWTLSGVLSGIDEGDPEFVYWRGARGSRLSGHTDTAN